MGAVVTVAVIRELDLRALVVEGFRRYTEVGAIFFHLECKHDGASSCLGWTRQ